MHICKKIMLFVSVIILEISSLAFGKEIILINQSDEHPSLYIDPTDNFVQVLGYIENCLDAQLKDESIIALVREDHLGVETGYSGAKEFNLKLTVAEDEIIIQPSKALTSKYRHYYSYLTSEQKKDIYYLIKTLAWSSLIEIGRSTSSLKSTGKRIKPIHPLKFLAFIFNEEKLKVGMHAIRDRGGLVWRDFSTGLVDCLEEEAKRDNLKTEFVQDFAAHIQIDLSLILPLIQKSEWKKFINLLIDKIPRANDPNRYNM